MKNLKGLWTIFLMVMVLAVVALCGCERSGETSDPRLAFVGEYTFVSTGDIDLYLGSTKAFAVPMDKEGEMSIKLAEKSNAVWIIAEGDSVLAAVSGNELYMEPMKQETTVAGISMDMSFSYGKATLENNQLSWITNVDITATYMSLQVTGSGQVVIVATKK